MNKIILIGNITKNPETRQAGSNEVTTFTVATSQKWTDKQGQKQEKVQFHNCQMWNKQGMIFGQYHKKGDRCCVTGMVEYDTYEKDGQKKYITRINVKEFEFVKNSGVQNNDRDINQDVNQDNQLPF